MAEEFDKDNNYLVTSGDDAEEGGSAVARTAAAIAAPAPSTSRRDDNKKPSRVARATKPGAVAVNVEADVPAVMEPSMMTTTTTSAAAAAAAAPKETGSGRISTNRRGGGGASKKKRYTAATTPGAVAVTGSMEPPSVEPTPANTTAISSNANIRVPRSGRNAKARTHAPASRPGAVAVVGTAKQQSKDAPATSARTLDAAPQATVTVVEEPETLAISSGRTRSVNADVPTSTEGGANRRNLSPKYSRTGKGRPAGKATTPGAVAVDNDVVEASTSNPLETVTAKTSPKRTSPTPRNSFGKSNRRGRPSSSTTPGAVAVEGAMGIHNSKEKKAKDDSKTKVQQGKSSISRGSRFSSSSGPESNEVTPGAVNETGGSQIHPKKHRGRSSRAPTGKEAKLDLETGTKLTKEDGLPHPEDDYDDRGYADNPAHDEEPVEDPVFQSGAFDNYGQRDYSLDEAAAEATVVPSVASSHVVVPTSYPLQRPTEGSRRIDQGPINAAVRPFDDWREEERERGKVAHEQKVQAKKVRCTLIIILMVLIAGGAIGGVVAGVGVGGGGGGETPAPLETTSPSGSPSAAPTIDLTPCIEHTLGFVVSPRYTTIRGMLATRLNSTLSIDTPGSPQRLALCWLSEFDGARLPTNDTDPLLERYAMATLYYAMNGPKSNLASSNWLSSDSICDWGQAEKGGTKQCYTRRDINALRFISRELAGTLPSEIQLLSSLAGFELFDNEVEGTLPTELFSIANLVQIQVTGNKFVGTIPSEIGGLSWLDTFLAADNLLSGSIPTEIASLGNLKFLGLPNNRLTGPVPATFLSRNIQEIALDNNRLTGTLPSFPNAANLKIISATSNVLRGSIAESMGNLTELATLQLSSNRLTGTIPPSLGRALQLATLHLDDNSLTGTIPSTLGNLVSAIDMDFRFNRGLSGAIPNEICLLRSGNLSSLVVPCGVVCQCCSRSCNS